jgi:hypothetical protein
VGFRDPSGREDCQSGQGRATNCGALLDARGERCGRLWLESIGTANRMMKGSDNASNLSPRRS